MAISDVAARFEDAFANKSKLQSFSLPLPVRGGEVLFFYYANGTDSGAVVKEITHAAVRGTESGAVSLEGAPSFLAQRGIAMPQQNMEVTGPTGASALRLVERYYALYEQVLPFAFAPAPTQEQKTLLADFLSAFLSLVPAGAFRDFYVALGSDFFTYIKEQTGAAP